ncbi:MogA/MoaB family molybdenum cofactor biosynthesis protein [Priestia abyssalis]|uniref:MogA/MoaB family molybdenum cofactor biosynthesis protein n=1 Tax=Priestia abyssalis TaxID=1221450 RepID=UPI000994DA8D|nr:MogA/MoaB family molybdenum cofactor biosynthesis protein [Priestia abyssalis]
MNHNQHILHAPNSLRCAVVTVSDTRTEETDKSGQRIMSLLQEQNHEVRFYKIVTDDEISIREAVIEAAAQPDIDAVITNGGTGIASRDVTIETVKPLLEKEIVGFGELFRMLSYTEDIGSRAMLSRAVAGVREKKVIFSLPGSTGAVTLGMNKLILPELRHVISEIRK